MSTSGGPRQVRVRGFLTTSYWDEETHRWHVALIDEHGREYFVAPGIDEGGLNSHLEEDVTVWGAIFEQNGKTMIHVQRFEADYAAWADALEVEAFPCDGDDELSWDHDDRDIDWCLELGTEIRHS